MFYFEYLLKLFSLKIKMPITIKAQLMISV